MARIRTIKPEFCTSEQIVGCSRDARLLFIEMWMFCDDAGIHPDSPKRLKMECFPGDDDVGAAEIEGWVAELVVAGLLLRYEVEGKSYLWVTGWDHQKIEKPYVRHPLPPGVDAPARKPKAESVAKAAPEPAVVEMPKPASKPLKAQHSENGRRTVVERSPPERSLRKGVESKKTRAHASRPPDHRQRLLPLVAVISRNDSGLCRASRASGPNLADPAVRKQIWEQRCMDYLRETRPPAEVAALITAYVEDKPEGKRAFEAASAALRRRKEVA